mgnify:CR=1 FL=1
MIKIETTNETAEGYYIKTRIEGTGFEVLHQMTAVLDKMYDGFPELFEMALVHSKYAEDHT